MAMATSSGLLGPDGFPISSSPDTSIINNNFWNWVDNWAEGVMNPDNIPLSKYLHMLDTDETVFSGVEFLKMSVLAKLGDYCHEEEEVEDFVRENLVQMEGDFVQNCSEILSALPLGFSASEILWRPGTGSEVRLRGIQTLHPDSVTFDIHREGYYKNQLKAIHQFWRSGTQEATILPEKAIVLTHRGDFGNMYGRPGLKAAYKSWFIKDAILRAWGLCCERYGTPYTVGKTNQGTCNIDGIAVDNFRFLGSVLDSMGKKGSLVLDKQTELEIHYAPQGLGQAFEALVAYCNKMIYRALGLPSLIADEGSSGSYSLGKQHFALFQLVVETNLNALINCLIEQLVRPLIGFKFGEMDDYGTFASAKLQAEDELAIAQVALALTNANINRDDSLEDQNYWRERIGMPLLEEGDLEPSLPIMPGLPGQDPNLPPDQQEQQPPPPTPPKSFSLEARRQYREALRKRSLALFTAASTRRRSAA